MATVSYPGVYVEEVSSGIRPIESASTSTAAFVGLAEMGSDNEARRITSWTAFQKYYGSYINDGYLAESVFQFFNNGGAQCYIVRITRSDATTASVTLENRAAAPVAGLTFSAKNEGSWGNYLYLQIENGSSDSGNTFKISIRKQDEVDLIPGNFANIAPLEVHDDLSMDAASSNYVVDMLSRDSNLIDASVDVANTSLQSGFHRSDDVPELPVNPNLSFQINLDGDGYQVITLAAGLANQTLVAAAIEAAVTALTRLRTSTDTNAFTGFTCTVVDAALPTEHLLLTSGTASATSSVRIQNASSNNAAASLKLGEGNGGYSENGLADRRPANASSIQVGDAAVASPITAVALGSDGSAGLTELSYSAGFTLLDNKTDFSLLAVPGVGTETMVDSGMAYCQNRPLQDVFYIGEMDQYDDTASEAESFRNALTTPNSYGAVYFPWIQST